MIDLFSHHPPGWQASIDDYLFKKTIREKSSYFVLILISVNILRWSETILILIFKKILKISIFAYLSFKRFRPMSQRILLVNLTISIITCNVLSVRVVSGSLRYKIVFKWFILVLINIILNRRMVEILNILIC